MSTGGNLIVVGPMTVGATNGNHGLLALQGAGTTADIQGTLYIGQVGLSGQGIGGYLGAGSLHVDSGAQLTAPLVYISRSGRFSGDLGSLHGNVQNHGTTSPGHSPGTLTIDGDFEQFADGILEMEIAGTGPEQFDVLAVTGVTQLGGTLQLVFRNGFAPHTGDVFDLFEGPSALGTFDAVEVLGLEPGWQYALDPASLRVTSLNDGVAIVPEPSALACLIGLSLFVTVKRRRSP